MIAGEDADEDAVDLTGARVFGAAGWAFCVLRADRTAGFGAFLAGGFTRFLTPVLSFLGIYAFSLFRV